MSHEFEGKRVLITGGAKGIGKAIAKAFAKRGAQLIINYFHSHDDAKRTAEELSAAGVAVELMRASVAREDQVNRMFDEVESRFGGLDILINNAAHGVLLSNDEITDEHLDRAMNTNFRGALWCSRRAGKLMPPGGAIVNMSSLGANWVVANYLAVGTSKAALESLTRYLAVEYAGRGIRVNAVSANLVDGAVANMFPDPEGTKRSSILATPLKRLATEDELANIALFLASPAASWITGQVIVADGGLTLASEALGPRVAETPSVQPTSAAAPIAPEGLEDDDVVVVAMGLALPGASTPDEFWELLEAPRELFDVVPADRWDYHNFYDPDPTAVDKSYQANSVFISEFKPHARLAAEVESGAAPEEMTTRWLRHALMQALEGTHISPGDRTTFYVGYTADGSQHLEEAMVLAGLESRAKGAETFDASAHGRLMAAARARYHRGAKGFAEFLPHRVGLEAMKGVLPDDTDVLMVDTACSSSLYSIDLGLRAIRQGGADVAICGGAFGLAPRGKVLFSKLSGLSRGGRVRSLDKSADGVLFADGAGVVVLKRWSRARRDGDAVLGVIEAFGASSDGKGKAIYAPSSDGQAIAIRRAYPQDCGLEPKDIDWVIAHATGTPAGDLAEFDSLRRMFDGNKEIQVTSNKSLIGHTGWTAGVASVIQALLSLKHGRISKQFRFESPPADFKLDASRLRIPKEGLAWPMRPGHRRRAAVSGFGFGGTNGHLVVGEASAAGDARRKAAGAIDESPLAIVGWSAVFPQLAGREAVEAWLRGQGPAPQRSFGAAYPLPPFERVRMPPAVLRILDRCQLMALDAAHELREALQPFWNGASDEISVVMGHMGATGNAALYATRCYMDDVERAVADDAPARALLQHVRTEVCAAVAQTSENSFPGMMPNVIPARVANYYDLHGPNMTIDMGRASFYAALQAAARYLRAGDARLAVVGGINGNATPECAPASAEAAAEGIILFGVMTLEAARAAGVATLATLDAADLGAAVTPSPLATRDGAASTWLGADGALDLLRTIVGAKATTIGRAADSRAPVRHGLQVRPTGAGAATHSETIVATPAKAPLHLLKEEESASPPQGVDGLTLQLERFAIEWRQEAPPAGRPTPFLPEKVVLLTNEPALIEALGPLPATARVLSLAPFGAARPGWTQVTSLEEGALEDILPADVKHLRIIASGALARRGEASLAAVSEEALKLHDLAFLAIKRAYDALGKGGDLFVLLTEAVREARQHPMCGLFSGLVKSLSLELPGCRSRLLSVSDADLAAGVRKMEREAESKGELPVALYDGETRYALGARHVTGNAFADAPLPLGPDSVIVAIGGARGITAETLKGLLPLTRSKVWLVGASPLNEDPTLLDLDDEAFAKTRPAFMRDAMTKNPGLGPVGAARRFDRLIADRTVRRTIDRFRALCGADRVRYVRADVLDRAALDALAARVAAEDGRVDFLINAAGIGRSAAINAKTLAEFRSIRDVKARGYLNLRAAFASLAPKIWCNFGSLIGLTGQSGEADYASGNDFLNANAFWNRAKGTDEFTIGWTLWGEVGMASNELLRAFYESSDFYTTTRPAEGVWHFLRELRIPDRGAATVQLGANEKTAMGSLIPGFLENSRKRALDLVSSAQAAAVAVKPQKAVEKGAFYLGSELSRTREAVEFERIFDLGSDGYLQDHVVNGFATLPGTFVTEITAEAALQLVQGLVIGFEDAVFHHFLRVYDRSRPMAKKISARVIDREGGQTRVQVLVTGDVVSPAGVVLKKDKLHFEMKAIVADDFGPAPVWTHWPAKPCAEIPDPYHFAAAPVLLTGPFVSTTATCETPLGKRARYDLKLQQGDPVFSRFVVPTILLDGLARVGVLHLTAGAWIPLAAPASIRRIDLWRPENDIELAHAVGPIDLYVTPAGFDLTTPDAANRFVAVGPDGRLIAQMRDVTGVVTGYVHKTTGEFMSAAAVDALVSASRLRAPALEGEAA